MRSSRELAGWLGGDRTSRTGVSDQPDVQRAAAAGRSASPPDSSAGPAMPSDSHENCGNALALSGQVQAKRSSSACQHAAVLPHSGHQEVCPIEAIAATIENIQQIAPVASVALEDVKLGPHELFGWKEAKAGPWWTLTRSPRVSQPGVNLSARVVGHLPDDVDDDAVGVMGSEKIQPRS